MSTIVRIIIKAILIIVAFYISGVILLFMKASGYDGVLPLFILVAAIAIIKQFGVINHQYQVILVEKDN